MATARRCPPPVVLFLLTVLLPVEYSFYIGELRLTVARVYLMAMFFPCLFVVLSGQCGKVRLPDYLMIGYLSWVMLAIEIHHGFGRVVETGGIYVVEGLGPYLLARRYLRTPSSFLGFAAFLVIIVISLSILTVPEAITGWNPIRGFASTMGRRFGLARARGPFEHPILYGVFCASAVGLAWFAMRSVTRGQARRAMFTAGVTLAAGMSVSSGAMAAMVIQYFVGFWDRVTVRIRNRWAILFGLMGMAYIAIDLGSNRTPMKVALYYLTFSAATAYNRITIWNSGMVDVKRNPLFGIGFNPWSKPIWMHSNSMDNFWLYIMVHFGLPALACLLIAILYTMIKLGRDKGTSPMLKSLQMGWIVSMIGMMISGCTVHLWGATFVYFSFLTGSGIWMLEHMEERRRRDPRFVKPLRPKVPRRAEPSVTLSAASPRRFREACSAPYGCTRADDRIG